MRGGKESGKVFGVVDSLVCQHVIRAINFVTAVRLFLHLHHHLSSGPYRRLQVFLNRLQNVQERADLYHDQGEHKKIFSTTASYAYMQPDGVQRSLVGPIISRFEQRGFKLAALKLVQASPEHLEKRELSKRSAQHVF